ncbi:hypothetical protein [Paracoccus sp. pheM1]|uniref:hypothetical protein n=1 Tax=Paracoccus sp. pheM1 TaxID=2831675 RepID=UPI001BDB9458|nr:hypothetical protein [Paracoccus sp. pheM1]MBT0782817.1 hypothetical protein [Paracoccus sp. pheM1]
MKKAMILVALTLLNLATTPGLAEPAARCEQAAQRCVLKTEAAKRPAVSDTGEQPRKGPKVGEVTRGGRSLRTAEARKLARPATGRAYRVVEERVVLVDAGTMKVLQVLGLASDILR